MVAARTQDDVGDEAATEREVRLDYVNAKRRDEQSRMLLLANKDWRVGCVEQMRQFGGWRAGDVGAGVGEEKG